MPRMTVEFNDDVTDMLEKLAKDEDRSKVEILRRALGLYGYLHEEVVRGPRNERQVAIVDKEKNIVNQLAWF